MPLLNAGDKQFDAAFGRAFGAQSASTQAWIRQHLDERIQTGANAGQTFRELMSQSVPALTDNERMIRDAQRGSHSGSQTATRVGETRTRQATPEGQAEIRRLALSTAITKPAESAIVGATDSDDDEETEIKVDGDDGGTGPKADPALLELIKGMQEQAEADRALRGRTLELETALQDALLRLQSIGTQQGLLDTFASPRATIGTPWFQAGREDQIPLTPRMGQILRGGGVGLTGNVDQGPVFLQPNQVNMELIRDLVRNIGARGFNVLSRDPNERAQFDVLTQLAGLDPRAVYQGIQSALPKERSLGQVLFAS